MARSLGQRGGQLELILHQHLPIFHTGAGVFIHLGDWSLERLPVLPRPEQMISPGPPHLLLYPALLVLTQSTACSAASCPRAATIATAATPARRTPRTCATTRVRAARGAGSRAQPGHHCSLAKLALLCNCKLELLCALLALSCCRVYHAGADHLVLADMGCRNTGEGHREAFGASACLHMLMLGCARAGGPHVASAQAAHLLLRTESPCCSVQCLSPVGPALPAPVCGRRLRLLQASAGCRERACTGQALYLLLLFDGGCIRTPQVLV